MIGSLLQAAISGRGPFVSSLGASHYVHSEKHDRDLLGLAPLCLFGIRDVLVVIETAKSDWSETYCRSTKSSVLIELTYGPLGVTASLPCVSLGL